MNLPDLTVGGIDLEKAQAKPAFSHENVPTSPT
jgi:hypothetical protein